MNLKEDKTPFIKKNLPSFPRANQEIKIYRDMLERFRYEYLQLLEFAALVCGVDKKEVCQFDMLKWIEKNMEPK